MMWLRNALLRLMISMNSEMDGYIYYKGKVLPAFYSEKLLGKRYLLTNYVSSGTYILLDDMRLYPYFSVITKDIFDMPMFIGEADYVKLKKEK
ncbi:MAG: hypothetical protein CL489_08645 [Acidobacteria bacterium]|nr:hypothetical protein [Acidobacteriota bacterium]|tara:strand:- start:35415 stop:35693 length:279 start_codon:yes stop_codon:yes gene_type:complete